MNTEQENKPNVVLLTQLKERVLKAKSLRKDPNEPPFYQTNSCIRPPDYFDMRTIYVDSADCGSVGCIIGFSVDIGENPNEENCYPHYAPFAKRFNLPRKVVDSICHPLASEGVPGINYEKITPQQVAQAIQNVIDGAESVQEVWNHIILPPVHTFPNAKNLN